jgi:predicted AlkP superfamily pyrophosphatase or phosphodiesterase
MQARPAELTFLYATDLDGVMHRHGPESKQAREAALGVASKIERARERLGRDAELTTFVVGDHGMAEVGRTVDPRVILHDTKVRYFIDSTFLRMWGTSNELLRARVRFDSHHTPGKWLDTRDLTARDAPVVGSPYGDAIIVLDEGIVFSPSYVGGVPRGMHGYDTTSASSRAALLSDAPLPERCAALVDVAGAVRGALGIEGAAS